MTADPQRLKHVFGMVIARDRADRDAVLQQECGSDLELRQRLEALLAAHDQPASALDAPFVPAERETAEVRTGTAAFAGPAVNDVIAGRYKLLEKIGEGGMGEVWVADQREPIRRKVAIKMIKLGMDSRNILARFEAERQALAIMDHPHVARVFDAGTTPDGRPFFAMELVKGTPITTFCDARQLTPRERLELFLPVCRAIHHAHQKGLIHRDIKPANVLVELHDDLAVPKVIDFGVAKAIGHQFSERTIYTGFGQLIGTPTYMAPEQATFNALDVDTRADVYALGVLLYEMLVGSPPFEPERLQRAALDEVLRVVREEDPQLPSTRLSTSATKASLAASRRSSPDELWRLIRGELDWIIMKTLEKDRARRYDSAASLAHDVERYLRDEAIEACPPTLSYRLRKACRRNRSAVLATAAVVCLALLGVVWQSWSLRRARRAEHIAVTERDKAAHERTIAETARLEVQHERDVAQTARHEQRRSLYGISLNLIAAAWEHDHVARVRELLDSCRPRENEEDLRGFEWHYWNRLAHAERRTWSFADDTPLVAATLSGDAQRVASCAFVDTGDTPGWRIRVCDVARETEVFRQTVERDDTLALAGDGQLALNHDGTRLAFTYRGDQGRRRAGRVLVYNVTDGQILLREEGRIERKTAISPDGTQVAIVSSAGQSSSESSPGRSARIRVHRVSGESPPLELTGLEAGAALVSAPHFSADGTLLAAVSLRHRPNGEGVSMIHLWELSAGQQFVAHTLEGEQVVGIAGAPRGDRLVTLGVKSPPPSSNVQPDAYITCWTRTDDRLTQRYSLRLPWVVSAVPVVQFAFSPDGRQLAVANGFQPAQCLDLEGGMPLPAVKSTTGIISVAFPPAGHLLRTLRNVPGNSPAAFPDGTLQEWDLSPSRPAPPALPEWSRSADGRRKLVSASWPTATDTNGPPLQVLEETGAVVGEYRGHTGRVVAAFLSPDGRWVLSNTTDEIVLWQSATGAVSWTRSITGDGTFQFDGRDGGEFSPDGRWIALRDPTATRVVSADDLQEQLRTPASADVRFSPDGRRLVVFQRGTRRPDSELTAGTLQVWDVESATRLREIAWPPGLALPTVFAPDGRTFAVASPAEVVIYDAATGHPRITLPGLPELGRVVFSPDGSRLVMVRRDGFDRHGSPHPPQPFPVWDTATGQVACQLQGHATSIRDAIFSPDGRRIFTAGIPQATLHGEIRVWDARSGLELLQLPHGTEPAGRVRLEISPDGHRLTLRALRPQAGRRREQIWDATPLNSQDRRP
ncbi:MAG: WD40 repeat domain-containing serine/threonine-protein kinase [Pirellulales bacterium]